MLKIAQYLLLVYCSIACAATAPQLPDFDNFMKDFAAGYDALEVPGFTLDYKAYFNAIPDLEKLQQQETFFKAQQKLLLNFDKDKLQKPDNLYFAHLDYEINLNLKRIILEKDWVQKGRNVPVNGLYEMPNYKDWYPFFIQKFTSTSSSPEEVHELGKREVKRVQAEIEKIQRQLGFADSSKFYQHLQHDTFFINNKAEILAVYERIDQTVRQNLKQFVDIQDVVSVMPMEWPNAGPSTPPGRYVNRESNAYNKDVFQYNFYNEKHNKRAMEWLYMHEAIPGHHLQSVTRRSRTEAPAFQQRFFYAGNAEGWACYVEYFGNQLGMYKNPYAALGKWEWDLVRSARLVIETGIHYYGWNREQALAYWKENIPGQDDIAEREVTRVTNWPGQALCYKVGADKIEKLAQNFKDRREFHRQFLELSYFPLAVVEAYLSVR
ncbi:MAG: DUF885 domain-containing protein [Saprospiraceae bacterium]